MATFIQPYFSLLVAAVICFSRASHAREPALSDLDALTGRWIELRGTLAEERRLWKNRRASWKEEIDLLEEQSTALGKELEATRDVLSTAEERRADVQARREAAETELALLDEAMEQASREAVSLAATLPSPLHDQLPADLKSFLHDGGANLTRTQRAQRLIAFLSSFESMQNRFHVVRQTLDTDTGRRQVDVIYIGLARAFAVSPANDWSATGAPGNDGWTWAEGSVDPNEVRTLIEVHERRETATLATLPLQVEDKP